MSTLEQRERWASMFGWRHPTHEESGYTHCWINEKQPQREPLKYLPDFAALTGPYFGPAVKELVDAGWKLYTPTFGGSIYYVWHYDNASIGTFSAEDDDLGICTMLALEAQRKESA